MFERYHPARFWLISGCHALAYQDARTFDRTAPELERLAPSVRLKGFEAKSAVFRFVRPLHLFWDELLLIPVWVSPGASRSL